HVTKNGKTTKIYQLEEETQALVLTDDAPLQAKEEQTNDPDLALDDIAALKLGEISFNIKNAESQQVLNNVSVHISRVDAHPIRSNQFTAITYLHEGISPLILPEGKYQCQFSLDGFAPLTKILNIQEKQLIAFDILLMPLDEKNLPTIQGQVTTPQGKAIPNAEVSIVLGNHISAPITIMQTNEEGDFALGLPKELISHLSSLKLIVHAEFFQTHIQEILDFDNQNSAWIEIQLAHEPLPSTVDDSND
ncbi:MAG: hypothetical protein OXE99_02015, partial [Cellvibrionales bacterium]|nr:hypothetical protein [Cellvibrionales bacterium]